MRTSCRPLTKLKMRRTENSKYLNFCLEYGSILHTCVGSEIKTTLQGLQGSRGQRKDSTLVTAAECSSCVVKGKSILRAIFLKLWQDNLCT